MGAGIAMCAACALALVIAGCDMGGGQCAVGQPATIPGPPTPAACIVVTPTSAPAVGRHEGPGRVYLAEHHFSIVPPQGFKSQGPSPDHVINFLGPHEEGFTVNLVVDYRSFSGDIENAAAGARFLIPFYLKGYKIAEDGYVTIDDKKSYFTTGTFTWNSRPARAIQYLVPGTGRLYILTFAASAAHFDEYRKQFEQSAATARVD